MLDNLTTTEIDMVFVVVQTEIIQHGRILEQLQKGEWAYTKTESDLEVLKNCRDKIADHIVQRRKKNG